MRPDEREINDEIRGHLALENVRLPGALPVLAAATVLAVAAVVASLMPAARAARVDVLQALRSE